MNLSSLYSLFNPNKKGLWILLFIFIFFISIDIWNWGNIHPMFFGIPYWVIYHILLTISIGLAFYIFTVFNWSDNNQ
jgi:hypothetical protein